MSTLGNKEIMAQNIRYYLKKYGKTQKEICKELGFKEMTFSDWVNAKTYPRIDKIEKIANYIRVQKADLVEEKRKPIKNIIPIEKHNNRRWGTDFSGRAYRSLSPLRCWRAGRLRTRCARR